MGDSELQLCKMLAKERQDADKAGCKARKPVTNLKWKKNSDKASSVLPVLPTYMSHCSVFTSRRTPALQLCCPRQEKVLFNSRSLSIPQIPIIQACRSLQLCQSSRQLNPASMPRMRGAFIVFEGIDRCGKTTQCTKLVEYLQQHNIPAELWRFPDRTVITGRTINDYLANKSQMPDEAIHLLFSANRWEKSQALVEKLQSGVTLVVDRYAYSGIAYSAAKQVPNMNLEWCKEPDAGLPAPDKVLYMKMSPEASAQRGGYGEERYEKAAFQKQVANMFESLHDELWATIDAAQTVDDVHAQVVQQVESVLKSVKRDPCIRRLWDYAPLDSTDAMPASSPTAGQRSAAKEGYSGDVNKAGQGGFQVHVTPGKMTSSTAGTDMHKDVHVSNKDQGVDA